MNQNFLAIIEVNTEKLDTWSGILIKKQMTELKATIEKFGTCDYYTVTDVKALEKFKAEIKRLNK
jgi:hypothetical protein